VKFAKIEANGSNNLYPGRNDTFERAELIIRGKLIAKGLKDNIIRFTSAERSPRPGDWGAINFQDSADNILRYCAISYGNTAIHGHGVQVVIENCRLTDNGIAIGYQNVPGNKTKSSVQIKQNHIVDNAGGVLCAMGTKTVLTNNEISNNKLYGVFGKKPDTVEVSKNNISRNGEGIVVYETKGFTIRQNNITENYLLNISLLEGQKWNVDATNNWWGTKDSSMIKRDIWDRERESGLGVVDFSAFLTEPVKNAGASG
jgi:parallel beta-helix repeat protein